jgi:hypothetical protein
MQVTVHTPSVIGKDKEVLTRSTRMEPVSGRNAAEECTRAATVANFKCVALPPIRHRSASFATLWVALIRYMCRSHEQSETDPHLVGRTRTPACSPAGGLSPCSWNDVASKRASEPTLFFGAHAVCSVYRSSSPDAQDSCFYFF